MDPKETMVDEVLDGAADDTLLNEPVEEEKDMSESLDSFLTEGTDEEPAEDTQEPEPKATEPGWIKKRVEKAVSKAVAEAVAETKRQMQAEFNQQMEPIRARMMEDEAQELVRNRKVTDIETARELVRLRHNQPAAAPAAPAPEPVQEQPRNSNGQFAAKEDPEASARFNFIEQQAQRVQAKTGIDVASEFINTEEVRRKIISGEMDFYDVAEQMKQQPKRPPSPTRSPNGASVYNPNSFMNMTDEQFERMEQKIKGGARFRLE